MVSGEVIVDADGNTHVVIKGEVSKNQKGASDESDYYLTVKPLQDRANAHCQYAGSDLTTSERQQLEYMIIQGNSLVNDIQVTQSRDQRSKLLLEKKVSDCQLALLAEKRWRLVIDHDYAQRRANEYYRQAETARQTSERIRTFLDDYNNK
jgi:hypothetical protein